MLPKFQFLVKLKDHEPTAVEVISNDMQTAGNTAVLSAQWKLGQKLRLIDSDGFPCAAINPPEGIQLVGVA